MIKAHGNYQILLTNINLHKSNLHEISLPSFHTAPTGLHCPVQSEPALSHMKHADGNHSLSCSGLLRPNDKILFIGDSITDAFRKPEEVNLAYQLGSGYALFIAGRIMSQHPEASFSFFNRGISGNRITDLLNRWDRDCLDLNPNVVSILVGVNCTLDKFRTATEPSDVDVPSFFSFYNQAIKTLLARHPQVRIVLCEPFMLECGLATKRHVVDIRQRAEAVRRLSSLYNATFVPFQSVLDAALNRAPAEYWTYDGVHPTAAGFWLLAETWWAHVANTPQFPVDQSGL